MTVTIAFGPAAGAAAAGAGVVSAGVSGALSAGLPQAALSASEGISHQLGTRRMDFLRIGDGLRGGVEARAQHFWIEPAGMIRPARLGARQPHLGPAEEQGIDLVEVSLVPLEDLVERRAVVTRGGGGHLLGEVRELLIARANGVVRLAAVEDAVVGPADPAKVV